jgi:hypothetical protein
MRFRQCVSSCNVDFPLTVFSFSLSRYIRQVFSLKFSLDVMKVFPFNLPLPVMPMFPFICYSTYNIMTIFHFNSLLHIMAVSPFRISLHIKANVHFNLSLYVMEIFPFILSLHGNFPLILRSGIKYALFWDVTPCGSCKNRYFGGTWRLLHQGDKNRWTRNVNRNWQPTQAAKKSMLRF